MGKGVNKVVRVVFCGNKYSCPDCNFVGNFTQVKLHLKATHKYTGNNFGKQHTAENCSMCGLGFSTRDEVIKHMLSMH